MAWEKSSKEVISVFRSQNPWIFGDAWPSPPPYRRALQRHVLSELLNPSLKRFEVILGPRRVGKTTLMQQLAADLIDQGIHAGRIMWMRLDHPMLMDTSLGNWLKIHLACTGKTGAGSPSKDSPVFLFLDEVLYAKDWAGWLKTFYDDDWPVRIIATGSATAALRQEHRESGVGRWREWYLSPLLFHDFLEIQGEPVKARGPLSAWLDDWHSPETVFSDRELIEKLKQFVMVGGFPELAVQAGDELSDSKVFQSQEVLREDAINRAIYKDLMQAYEIQNPLALEKLLYALAGQIGGIFRSENLGSTAGISQPTVDVYMKYLEDAGLIIMLRNYAPREETIQRRGRKVFFSDSALRNAALQRGIAPLQDPRELGQLYENAVAGHLEAYCRARQIRLFHWRDGRDEVDFVVGHPTNPVAIEITGGDKHTHRGLQRLFSKYAEFKERGWLISPTATSFNPTLAQGKFRPGEAPLAKWLLTCGLATDEAIMQRQ